MAEEIILDFGDAQVALLPQPKFVSLVERLNFLVKEENCYSVSKFLNGKYYQWLPEDVNAVSVMLVVTKDTFYIDADYIVDGNFMNERSTMANLSQLDL